MADKIVLSAYQVECALAEAQEILGGWFDVRVREEYPGRFMFGETCFGVIGPRSLGDAFIEAVEANENLGPAVAAKLAACRNSDNMGYDFIFYFPGFVLGDSNVIPGVVDDAKAIEG